MENQTPPRKKWSERQFELFLEVADELGADVSEDAFERVLDRVLSVEEPRRRSRRNGKKQSTDDEC